VGQNAVTCVNWAGDAAQFWDRAVYEMDEGKVITCVMAMLRQFSLLKALLFSALGILMFPYRRSSLTQEREVLSSLPVVSGSRLAIVRFAPSLLGLPTSSTA
jgi:hypothetical protein